MTKRKKSKKKSRGLIRDPKVYTVDEVLPHTLFVEKRSNTAKKNKVDFDGDLINMASDRYKTFAKHGVKCVTCGLEGTRFYKEKNQPHEGYHFNLYGVNEAGEEVLMTKDHIIPKAKGGKDILENYQTMCTVCNIEKSNEHIDFRYLQTQTDLEELLKLTSFVNNDKWDKSFNIHEPDADGYQSIWLPECSYLGSLVSTDSEKIGEDALFVQTLIQKFKEGRLKLLPGNTNGKF